MSTFYLRKRSWDSYLKNAFLGNWFLGIYFTVFRHPGIQADAAITTAQSGGRLCCHPGDAGCSGMQNSRAVGSRGLPSKEEQGKQAKSPRDQYVRLQEWSQTCSGCWRCWNLQHARNEEYLLMKAVGFEYSQPERGPRGYNQQGPWKSHFTTMCPRHWI